MPRWAWACLAASQLLVLPATAGVGPVSIDWCRTNSDLDPVEPIRLSCDGENGGGTGIPARVGVAGTAFAFGGKGYVNTTVVYPMGSIRYDCVLEDGSGIVGTRLVGAASCVLTTTGTFGFTDSWVLEGTQTRAIFGAVEHYAV